ncbi:MAG: hypothetical protein KDK34_15285, partial [Leptospiraceae bacterium]|nr:hypothetical protein [Leptospiraceae bacterium]
HLFCEGLERWLTIAGRKQGQDFRIVPIFHLEDVYPHRFVHFIPVAAIVWRAESPWLEQWLGRSQIIRLPAANEIRCAGHAQNEQRSNAAVRDENSISAEALPTKVDAYSHSQQAVKIRSRVAAESPAIHKQSPSSDAGNNGQSVYRNGNGHKPALQAEQATVVSVPDSFAGKTVDAHQNQTLTASSGSPLSASESNQIDSAAHNSDPISYCVAGTSRGRPARRYFLKKETTRVRLALLSAPELAARTQLAFFDRMQSRPHPVREHRDMLRSGLIRTDHASLSLEMKTNGEFVGLTSGLSLLIWRAGQKRAVLISSQPTEDHPEQRVRGLRGQLHPGDMLLMLPGRLTGAEWREIGELLKSAGNRAPLDVLQERLGTWLDYRNLGRALLLRQNTD